VAVPFSMGSSGAPAEEQLATKASVQVTNAVPNADFIVDLLCERSKSRPY
jgi:hypothetical protein